MIKVKVNRNIFYFELSSKSNVDVLFITVSMCNQHYFETIFTTDDVINVKDAIGRGFGYIEISYPMGVNA